MYRSWRRAKLYIQHLWSLKRPHPAANPYCATATATIKIAESVVVMLVIGKTRRLKELSLYISFFLPVLIAFFLRIIVVS